MTTETLIVPIVSNQKPIGSITANRDTKLKKSTKDSASSSKDNFVLIPKGTVLVALASAAIKDGHQLFTFKAKIGKEGLTNWFIYTGHWNLQEIQHDLPTDKPSPEYLVRSANNFLISSRKKDLITVPIYGKVSLSDPIPGCQSFSWSECTHDGTRIPFKGGCHGDLAAEDVVKNFIVVAKELQKIRDFYGRSIQINSWYRDPKTNRRVNGASDSRHLYGDAVDFTVKGIHCQDVYKRLNPTWKCGLASTVSDAFVHLDTRGLKYGGQYARWTYPF